MTKIQEILDFLNSIEGSGYGGMASFEIARANVKDMIGQPQTPSDVVQHLAWLQQYILGMDENNWKDMRLRAERQLEGLSVALSISRPLRQLQGE